MKNLMRFNFMAVMMAGLLFTTSCGDDNEILAPVTPEDKFDARLNNNLPDSLSATVFVSDVSDGEINVLLSFNSTEDMTRVYVTQNLLGAGDEKLDASDAFGVNDKGDGSIDLASDSKNAFQFELTFSTANLPSEGTIVYNFWATAGKGDFRDSNKRLAEGPAVLTINLGGTNPATLAKSYRAKMFAVPLADGTSETFISTLDGSLFKLSDGEEFASFWDFGYYWLMSPGSSLASTSAFPALFDHDSDANTALVAIAELTGTAQSELNNCYFASTTMTTAEFDAVTNSSELESVAVSVSDSEKVQNLEVDQIVAFMDDYGKKGLIRVTSITPGFGADGSMTIDIKVQP